MIFIPVFVYFILVIYEFVPLYKQKLWRDLWVNSVIGLASFSFAVMLALRWKVPSPAKLIQRMIEYFF
ncbi:hypothetical protein [Bacillus tuaregi]|uniref:hypothetical protein n=1 Tax=Bacillus tuaregi TaxID=1816695 RepID=UPI0008F8E34B|nr:hypothetical protein [Bacillus tuaregi]